MSEGYYLIGAGIIAIIIELIIGVATGFDLFIIGVLLIIGGVISTVSNLTAGLISVFFLSVFYIVFGRKFLKNSLSIETKKTNVEGIIGKRAIVIKEIHPPHPGQIKIEGEIWRAESLEHLETGKEVVIHSVTGVTLKVKSI